MWDETIGGLGRQRIGEDVIEERMLRISRQFAPELVE